MCIRDRALGDPDLAVRSEAASSLGKAKASVESVRRSPVDSVTLGRVARESALPAASFSTPEGRRIFSPVALGARELAPLLAQAQKATGEARLESIAQLGLSPSTESIALLEMLAAKDSGEPEDVRKTAYRALRRAQRRFARLGKEVRP